jgi:hypothetical protein
VLVWLGMRELLVALLVSVVAAAQSVPSTPQTADDAAGNATAPRRQSSTLPEAPQPQPRTTLSLPCRPANAAGKDNSRALTSLPPCGGERKVGFWTFGSWRDARPLRSNAQIWHDKTWRGMQAVWASSMVYDAELTHAGLAHHECVEGQSGLPQHPSRGELYVTELPELGVGELMSFISIKYLSKSEMFVIPAWGSIKHFRGGSKWLTECW